MSHPRNSPADDVADIDDNRTAAPLNDVPLAETTSLSPLNDVPLAETTSLSILDAAGDGVAEPTVAQNTSSSDPNPQNRQYLSHVGHNQFRDADDVSLIGHRRRRGRVQERSPDPNQKINSGFGLAGSGAGNEGGVHFTRLRLGCGDL
ncbi:hypothetical protein PanWU01x14_277700 [Parasponia andersonii]|uniref:Uncharacterized protein n=1 Tax=Parasponia andersonii TaxID=3476 RepID=A0A2P5B2G1_PARAD|nr:hypothetical protein PanWU01x14_277700 [Parasponia andersonii]